MCGAVNDRSYFGGLPDVVIMSMILIVYPEVFCLHNKYTVAIYQAMFLVRGLLAQLYGTADYCRLSYSYICDCDNLL